MGRHPRTGSPERPATTGVRFAASISPRGVGRALAWVVAGLVLLSVATQAAQGLLPDLPGRDLLADLFGLDNEWNFPTVYAALTLLACAALLEITGRVERRAGIASAGQWRLLALLFVGLTLDELLSFHELLNDRLDLGSVGSLTRFPWVVAGGAFAAAVAVTLRGFLARLPAGTRRRFLLAGALFVAGSLGVEAVGGRLSLLYGQRSLVYLAAADLEEILEMAGIIVFIQALLAHLGSLAEVLSVELRIGDRRGARDDAARAGTRPGLSSRSS